MTVCAMLLCSVMMLCACAAPTTTPSPAQTEIPAVATDGPWVGTWKETVSEKEWVQMTFTDQGKLTMTEATETTTFPAEEFAYTVEGDAIKTDQGDWKFKIEGDRLTLYDANGEQLKTLQKQA